MTYKAHPDDTLEAAFKASLTRDSCLAPIACEFGVSESLISRMRVRAENLKAQASQEWSERSLDRQLIKDGWLRVRRSQYQLPKPRRNWFRVAPAVTITILVFTIPVARWMF